jgi:hypothetical protein
MKLIRLEEGKYIDVEKIVYLDKQSVNFTSGVTIGITELEYSDILTHLDLNISEATNREREIIRNINRQNNYENE